MLKECRSPLRPSFILKKSDHLYEKVAGIFLHLM